MKYYTRTIERFPLAPVVTSHGALTYALMNVGLHRSLASGCVTAQIFKRDPSKFPNEPPVTSYRGKVFA